MSFDQFIQLSELLENESIDQKKIKGYLYQNKIDTFYWSDCTHQQCRKGSGPFDSRSSTLEGSGYLKIQQDFATPALRRGLIKAEDRPFTFSPECFDAPYFEYEFRKKDKSFDFRVSRINNADKITIGARKHDELEVEVEKLKIALTKPLTEYSLDELYEKIDPKSETYISDYIVYVVDSIVSKAEFLKLSQDINTDDFYILKSDTQKIGAPLKEYISTNKEEFKLSKLQDIISALMFFLVKNKILLGEPKELKHEDGKILKYYPEHNECIQFLYRLKTLESDEGTRFSKRGFVGQVLDEIKRESKSHPNLVFEPRGLGIDTFVRCLDGFMQDKCEDWPQGENVPKWKSRLSDKKSGN